MSDSFSHTTRIDASPDEAWPRLQVADVWAGIAGIDRVYDATHDDAGQLTGFSFEVVAAGTRVSGKAVRTEYRENELLVLSISSSELVGTITTRLVANDASGTKLRMVLEMRARGLLAGMFYPLIAQTVGKNLPEQVEKIGRRLEA